MARPPSSSWSKDAGEFYLKPLNTRYPIKPLGDAEIIGVVREFSKTFR